MELTIVGQNGWKKPYKLGKALLRIGSAPVNDIQISSTGVISIHLQVMYAPETPASCKVLNFGPAVQLVSGGKESAIESYTTMDLRDGDELILGEYHILFRLPLFSGLVLSSRQIAASLSMGDAVLRPELPAIGHLRLQNLGTSPNCQFQVVVNGLSEECYQVDPPPTLYPGAEEDVRIQFFHRAVTPPAGYQTITVSVTAPTSYPGEQVIIQQGIYVSPLLKAGISIKDDMPVPKVEKVVPPPLPAENAGLAAVAVSTPVSDVPVVEAKELPLGSASVDNTPIPKADGPVQTPLPGADAQIAESAPENSRPVSPEVETNEPQAVPAPEVFKPVIPVRRDLSTTKVARNPSEKFWDENS